MLQLVWGGDVVGTNSCSAICSASCKQLFRFVVTREPHQQIGIVLTVQTARERRQSSVSRDGRTMVWFRLVESAYTASCRPMPMLLLSSAWRYSLVGGKLRGEIARRWHVILRRSAMASSSLKST